MNQLVDQLAQLCIDAYPDYEEEHEWRNRLRIKWPGIEFHQESGQSAFSFIEDNRLFVIYRGTELSFNWITNFMIGKHDMTSGAKVHRGFHIASTTLWSQGLIGQKIMTAIGNDMRVVLAGHSLGAAMATITAWVCQFSGMPIEMLLAMNSPRVGNLKFAWLLDAELGARWVRTQHSRDIVSDSPPSFLGYKHGGKHVFFDRNREASINPRWGFVEWDRWLERWSDWKKGKFFHQIAKDHDVKYNAELIHLHRDKICPPIQIIDMDIPND